VAACTLFLRFPHPRHDQLTVSNASSLEISEAFGSHLRFDNKIQDVLKECLKKSVPANLIPKKPQGNLESE